MTPTREQNLENMEKCPRYENSRKYYLKHREAILEKAKEYYLENKNSRLEYYKKIRKYPNRKYGHYKDNAQRKNIKWELTFEEFMTLWQKPCFYCDSKIETIGIDRIDNNKGYVIDNIVSCCSICNYMKRELSKKDFIKQINKIFFMSERVELSGEERCFLRGKYRSKRVKGVRSAGMRGISKFIWRKNRKTA